MYVIIHQIFEPDFSEDTPIVEHAFYGRTPKEARLVYDTHKKYDRFLKSCDDSGKFGKTTVCNTKVIGPRKVIEPSVMY